MSLSFNHFGFIDYKKPKNDIQMDYRTSYYHAHKILDDPKLQSRSQIQSDTCKEYKPYGDMKMKSDYQENFVHQVWSLFILNNEILTSKIKSLAT